MNKFKNVLMALMLVSSALPLVSCNSSGGATLDNESINLLLDDGLNKVENEIASSDYTTDLKLSLKGISGITFDYKIIEGDSFKVIDNKLVNVNKDENGFASLQISAKLNGVQKAQKIGLYYVNNSIKYSKVIDRINVEQEEKDLIIYNDNRMLHDTPGWKIDGNSLLVVFDKDGKIVFLNNNLFEFDLKAENYYINSSYETNPLIKTLEGFGKPWEPGSDYHRRWELKLEDGYQAVVANGFKCEYQKEILMALSNEITEENYFAKREFINSKSFLNGKERVFFDKYTNRLYIFKDINK